MEEKLESLRRFLTPDKPVAFYQRGSSISWAEVKLIRSLPGERRKYLFPKTPPIVAEQPKYRYSVELKCEQCGELFWLTNISKTAALGAITSSRWGHKLCSKCEIANEEAGRLKLEQQDNERREALKAFLTPAYSFPDGLPARYKFQSLQSLMPYGWARNTEGKEIASQLKALPYQDFLHTPYWDAISAEIKRKANYKCSLCGSSSALNVHHKTYAHHGNEFYHLEDLICLCKDCHYKFHKKEEDSHATD